MNPCCMIKLSKCLELQHSKLMVQGGHVPSYHADHVPNFWGVTITNLAWAKVRKYKISYINKDSISWSLTNSGRYTFASTWNALRKPNPKVNWYNLTQGKFHVPRHSFIAQLALKGRLAAKEMMYRWGIVDNDVCSFSAALLKKLLGTYFLSILL